MSNSLYYRHVCCQVDNLLCANLQFLRFTQHNVIDIIIYIFNIKILICFNFLNVNIDNICKLKNMFQVVSMI